MEIPAIFYKLAEERNLPDEALKAIIEDENANEKLSFLANNVRQKVYKNKIYIRGLIEVTNYCKNDCYYCGLRKSNLSVDRYRLNSDDILLCCAEGYALGFRTFVLQGGEDLFFNDERTCEIISEIKRRFPDCALTLSLGEKSRETYKKYFDAGADRYLLRHETASDSHYARLHPPAMSLENRKKCLFALKETGFQTGSGFMVDSPFQTTENIIADIRFLQHLQPHMIGIGPYITHSQTPFAACKSGSVNKTLRLISILRLIFPFALIPATTALGTLRQNGRELGILAGANVVMPNLSPLEVRKKYSIYDNKLSSGCESAQMLNSLKLSMKEIGYEIVTDIGNPARVTDFPNTSDSKANQ